MKTSACCHNPHSTHSRTQPQHDTATLLELFCTTCVSLGVSPASHFHEAHERYYLDLRNNTTLCEPLTQSKWGLTEPIISIAHKILPVPGTYLCYRASFHPTRRPTAAGVFLTISPVLTSNDLRCILASPASGVFARMRVSREVALVAFFAKILARSWMRCTRRANALGLMQVSFSLARTVVYRGIGRVRTDIRALNLL